MSDLSNDSLDESTTRKGLFITLEGGEGAGKTSQINMLAGMLAERGYKVLTTREPGGTKEAESIRNLLVQRDGGEWNAMAETLLLFAARAMHIEKVIKPALEAGTTVICDRFTDSTVAYQGYGRGLSLEKIYQIERTAIDGFAPDMTIILDIEAEEGLNRSNKRLAAEKGYDQTEDRFERMEIEFHNKLRQGFLEIAKKNPDRCFVVNAAQSMQEVYEEINAIAFAKVTGGI